MSSDFRLVLDKLISSGNVGSSQPRLVDNSPVRYNSPSELFDQISESIADRQLSIRTHERLLEKVILDPLYPWTSSVRASRRLQNLDPEDVGELPPFRTRSSSLGNPEQLFKFRTKTTVGSPVTSSNFCSPTLKMSKVKIEKFKPGEDTVEEWIENYERQTKAHAMTASDKLNNLPCYLAGAPLKWFLAMEKEHEKSNENLEQAEKRTLRWEEVLRQLLADFKGATQQQEWHFVLRDRQQGQGENIEEYLYDVIRLCDRAEPYMTEKDKIGHVMKGLLPSVLDKISMCDNSTMSRLKANISRAQAAKFLLNQRLATDNQLRQVAPVSLGPDDSIVRKVDMLAEQVQHLVRLSLQREASVNAFEHQGQYQRQGQFQNHDNWQQQDQGNFQPHGQGRFQSQMPQSQNQGGQAPFVQPEQGYRRQFQRSKRSRPVCYLCQKEGHMVLTCPELRRAKEAIEADKPQAGVQMCLQVRETSDPNRKARVDGWGRGKSCGQVGPY
jgi:hypothetical protein